MVPLSDRCIEILEQMAAIGRTGLVFPSRRGHRLSENTLLDTLEQLGCGATVHGFRSTFRDWSGDCTGFARDICEAALGHVIENKVEAAYRRGSALEKRRQLMQAWARRCATSSADTSNVVAIGTA